MDILWCLHGGHDPMSLWTFCGVPVSPCPCGGQILVFCEHFMVSPCPHGGRVPVSPRCPSPHVPVDVLWCPRVPVVATSPYLGVPEVSLPQGHVLHSVPTTPGISSRRPWRGQGQSGVDQCPLPVPVTGTSWDVLVVGTFGGLRGRVGAVTGRWTRGGGH